MWQGFIELSRSSFWFGIFVVFVCFWGFFFGYKKHFYLFTSFQEVGCDDVVGSHAALDLCGVCNGDGTTCRIVKDVFETKKLEYGYNKIGTLPAGATSINITQLDQSRNYIGMCIRCNVWSVRNVGVISLSSSENHIMTIPLKKKKLKIVFISFIPLMCLLEFNLWFENLITMKTFEIINFSIANIQWQIFHKR